MTVGQREKITYRVVVRAGRSGTFLPPGGVGYGLGEGLGIVLNRIVKGPSKFRTSRGTVVGVIVEETPNYIIVERSDGRRLKIRGEDIIKRTVVN